jgi:hypothetical protein
VTGSSHGDKSKKTSNVRMSDSIDQERDRLESQGRNYRDEGGYAPEYNDVPQTYSSKPMEPVRSQAPKQLSYMEQKKLELQQYQSQNQANSYQPYEPEQDQYGGMTEEEEREYIRRQMELEVAQEMEKMNQQNDAKFSSKYQNIPDEDQYENHYQAHNSYQPQAKNNGLGIGSNDPVKPTGGKAVIKRPVDNKFLLSGSGEESAMNKDKRSGRAIHETSSGSYGNYSDKQLSKFNN